MREPLTVSSSRRSAVTEPGRAPTEDDLPVCYLPDEAECRRAVERIEGLGHRSAGAVNAYRDRHGKTCEDPDGYRVILQNAARPAR